MAMMMKKEARNCSTATCWDDEKLQHLEHLSINGPRLPSLLSPPTPLLLSSRHPLSPSASS